MPQYVNLFLFKEYFQTQIIFFFSICSQTDRGGVLQWYIQILPPCNYCHHSWCVGDKSYHKALIIMYSCDGISDHASWNEVFNYWDTKFSSWEFRVSTEKFNACHVYMYYIKCDFLSWKRAVMLDNPTSTLPRQVTIKLCTWKWDICGCPANVLFPQISNQKSVIYPPKMLLLNGDMSSIVWAWGKLTMTSSSHLSINLAFPQYIVIQCKANMCFMVRLL